MKSDIITLSRKAFEKDRDMAVAQAHQAGFDEGLQAGIQGIIGTMLCLGSHPEFIAKVTDLSLSHIQELHNRLIQEEENAHG